MKKKRSIKYIKPRRGAVFGKGFNELVQGRVKFFNEAKRYGFIEQEGSEDVFFHASKYRVIRLINSEKQLERIPVKDEFVRFLAEEGEKGLHATYFMYEDEYLEECRIASLTTDEMMAEYLEKQTEVLNFMGVKIFLPGKELDNPTFLINKKLPIFPSVEDCIACIAWAALFCQKGDQKMIMKEVSEIVEAKGLDWKAVATTATDLDNQNFTFVQKEDLVNLF